MGKVRKKQCADCPFRIMTQDEIYDAAVIDPDNWGCHTEQGFGWTDIQCRGHWRSVKKYPPDKSEIANFKEWQVKFNRAFADGLDIDCLPEYKRDLTDMESSE